MIPVEHQYFQDKLSAYADNELPGPERARLEDHLRDCAECRKRLSDIQKLGDLAGRLSPFSESDYWEQAAQKIERALPETTQVVELGRERVRRSTLWWRLPAIAASVLILGYIGFHESDILNPDIMEPPAVESAQPSPSLQTPSKEIPESAIVVPERDQTVEQGETPPEVKQVKKPAEPRLTAPPPEGKQVETPKPDSDQPERRKDTDGLVKRAAELPSPAREDTSTAESDYLRPVRVPPSVSVADSGAPQELLSLEETLSQRSKTGQTGPEELAPWRAKRDSLLQVVADLGDTLARPLSDALKFSAVPSKPKGQAGASSLTGGPIESKANRERAEAALVEAWCEICKLSSDSTEVTTGIEYLKAVSESDRSANSGAARVCLDQLERQ